MFLHKYLKYKRKYLQKKKENIIQTGGGLDIFTNKYSLSTIQTNLFHSLNSVNIFNNKFIEKETIDNAAKTDIHKILNIINSTFDLYAYHVIKTLFYISNNRLLVGDIYLNFIENIYSEIKTKNPNYILCPGDSPSKIIQIISLIHPEIKNKIIILPLSIGFKGDPNGLAGFIDKTSKNIDLQIYISKYIPDDSKQNIMYIDYMTQGSTLEVIKNIISAKTLSQITSVLKINDVWNELVTNKINNIKEQLNVIFGSDYYVQLFLNVVRYTFSDAEELHNRCITPKKITDMSDMSGNNSIYDLNIINCNLFITLIYLYYIKKKEVVEFFTNITHYYDDICNKINNTFVRSVKYIKSDNAIEEITITDISYVTCEKDTVKIQPLDLSLFTTKEEIFIYPKKLLEITYFNILNIHNVVSYDFYKNTLTIITLLNDVVLKGFVLKHDEYILQIEAHNDDKSNYTIYTLPL